MLHTVNKSPFERNNLLSCMEHAVAGSAILLYEDGVYAALKNGKFAEQVAAKAKECKIYVLGPDMTARGLDHGNVPDGVTVLADYGAFVDATIEHGTVQSWL